MAVRISHSELLRRLHYDPATGIFTWQHYRCGRALKGAAAGYKHHTGYPMVRLDDREYPFHRLAFFYMTGRWPKRDMDHINRVCDDNRWENLREATRSQNVFNGKIRSVNKTGVTGIYFDKRHRKFAAQIKRDGKQITIGRYSTLTQAAITLFAWRWEILGDVF